MNTVNNNKTDIPALWSKQERDSARSSKLFRSTIKCWNAGHFNSRRNIGYAMYLTRDCNPVNFDEWEKYYFESGAVAEKLKDRLPSFLSPAQRTQEIKNIDVTHGKTPEKLNALAQDFRHMADTKFGIKLTPEQAFNFTCIRAVDEAYIGFQREMACENWLDEFTSKNGLMWKSTDAATDIKQAVDYEIYDKDGSLVCGIQTKGVGWKKDVERGGYMAAMNRHVEKQISEYRKEHNNTPVFFTYIDRNFNVQSRANIEISVLARRFKMTYPPAGRGDFAVRGRTEMSVAEFETLQKPHVVGNIYSGSFDSRHLDNGLAEQENEPASKVMAYDEER